MPKLTITPFQMFYMLYFIRSKNKNKNKSLIQSTYKILSESNNLTITNRENKKGQGRGGRGRAGERGG